MSTIKLEIVTPERKVYDKEVNMVVVKGAEGELGILPRHIPLVTPLRIGPVRAKFDRSEELIAVNGGFMEVRKEKIVILAESAELPDEIDLQRALAAKTRAERRLQARTEEVNIIRAEIALQKAMNRIELAKRNRVE